jgi:hypothetical protein
MDLDDDDVYDDEGSCFKSKPAALRHAAHIFFVLLLLVVEWYSFVSMLRFVRSAMNARGVVLKRVVTNGAKRTKFNTRN